MDSVGRWWVAEGETGRARWGGMPAAGSGIRVSTFTACSWEQGFGVLGLFAEFWEVSLELYFLAFRWGFPGLWSRLERFASSVRISDFPAVVFQFDFLG